jgi:hypothetical protein
MRRTYKKRGGDSNKNKKPITIKNSNGRITIKNPNGSITIKNPNGIEFTLPKKKPNSKINLSIKESFKDEIERSKQMIEGHLKNYKKSINNMTQLEKILSNGSPEKNVSNNNYARNILNTARQSIIISSGTGVKDNTRLNTNRGLNDKFVNHTTGHIQNHKRKLKSLLDKHKTKLNNAYIKEIEELLENVKNV